MNNSYVEFRELQKSFGSTSVLHGINLQIEEGGFVVLVGPSGCGKSTLLRMTAGLEPINSGQISIADRVVNRVPPKDRGIAMVFQSYALYPHMSVADNLSFSLKMNKSPLDRIAEAVKGAASILQLSHAVATSTRSVIGRPATTRCHGARACPRTGSISVRRTAVEP